MKKLLIIIITLFITNKSFGQTTESLLIGDGTKVWVPDFAVINGTDSTYFQSTDCPYNFELNFKVNRILKYTKVCTEEPGEISMSFELQDNSISANNITTFIEFISESSLILKSLTQIDLSSKGLIETQYSTPLFTYYHLK